MSIKTTTLELETLLTTDEDIKIFLQDMAENGTPKEFFRALGTAAKAKGMTGIANQVGVTRASLYKSLSGNGSPKYDTVSKVINAIGLKLTVTP